MEENLILMGVLLIFVGILLIFLGIIFGSKENVKTEWGFFGLIGPVPIGFWSSKKAFIFTVGLIIILVLVLTLMKRW
jgi:uncharacterized membrane protein